jgi:hypothetical protein
MHVYRIKAVGNEGRPIVLGTVDTATQALAKIRDALGDYPRAWVTDQEDLDVTWADLMRLAEAEQQRL